VSWKHKAFIGLGANLGDRRASLDRALELLNGDSVWVVAVSRYRETEPVGYTDQPRFLNAAALVETELSPGELLDRLLAIERELGRVRGEGPRFGPRTIDLDLLLYDDEIIAKPRLSVPHPRLHERRFVLEPLHELEPGLVVPGRGAVSTLLAGLE
jgi:2-amino-4-hydroxy-6-hydroxymethyldihydropteridine diphosphokinase